MAEIKSRLLYILKYLYNEATKDKKMESFAGLEGKIKIR